MKKKQVAYAVTTNYRIIHTATILLGEYYVVQKLEDCWLWRRWKDIRSFRHVLDAETFLQSLLDSNK